jgi:hypothetical protein
MMERKVREMIEVKPRTFDDLHILALNDPTIAAVLNVKQMYNLSETQALLELVWALYSQLKNTQKQFQEYMNNDTRPTIVIKNNT